MLTIKRHFPINRLALSKAWYDTKDFFGRVGHSFAASIASLRDRSHAMGKKSILSSLVVLVGFFGSLTALLILYPIATQQGGPFTAGSPQANVESRPATPATETLLKDGESAKNTSSAPAVVEAPHAPPLATGPAPAPQPAPIAPQPAVSTTPTPSATSPMMVAPAPSATITPPATADPVDPSTAPTGDPIDTTINTLNGVVNEAEGVTSNLVP